MLLSSTDGTAPLAASTARPLRAEIRVQAPPLQPAESVLAKTQKSDGAAPTEVENALKTLNQLTAMVAQDVRFTMDEESGKTIVKVVDTATQEVLRQFPSAEALSIARSIDKMQGLLIREKA